ncbi:hypothetical protein ANO14919_047870 [Xylariales sp. No.14919]|nr:hypothetical protein ANO14919_047870 [Xylariales sp. No.14919]
MTNYALSLSFDVVAQLSQATGLCTGGPQAIPQVLPGLNNVLSAFIPPESGFKSLPAPAEHA